MTAAHVLAAQLLREYRVLQRRDFMASLEALVDRKPHTPHPRIKFLYAWLMEHPPSGDPYRCKYCLYGTHSEDRCCAACWAW